jgi:tetratricopeptide (TPR) repeat protein
MRWSGWVLVPMLLGGCVYYNAMYNANRLARSARKAERDGRTFEANNLWGQVATKAESVVVRHPTSKYAGQAAVLRGVALARLGQCEQALGPLGRITRQETPEDLTEEARLATGRCHLALGNLAAADAAFSQVIDSKDPDRRREARFQQARLLRQAGRFQEALSALGDQRDPRANTERILALAGSGRSPEALALADSLLARGDTTKPWDSLLVTLGRQTPAAASSLVDRLRRLPNRRPELQARMLLEDGLRLTSSNTARAAQRFREAMTIGVTGEAAGRASVALVRQDLRRASEPQHLPPVMERLKGLAARYDLITEEVTRLGATIAGVHTAAVSTSWHTLQGDLRLFYAAEAARDSLEAPRLAEAIFRRIADEWPSSPYAPKAILAAQQLDPSWADSARALLEERYLDSPYLAMIRGDATLQYRLLEDSLAAFAASLAVRRPTGPRLKPGAPDTDVDKPRRRPQPAPGATRLPEP